MSIAEPLTVLNNELLQKIVPEIVELLATALHEGIPGPCAISSADALFPLDHGHAARQSDGERKPTFS
jgi:hypothetical protein